MASTTAELEQKHARLQTALNATPADKSGARNQIMGDMRKIEAEFERLKNDGKKEVKKETSWVVYLAVSSVLIIAISFIVSYLAGLSM